MRGSDGCAWTKAQTFKSLTEHTLEEAYELVDAIEKNDMDELKGELADLLNQIVFYAQIAKEKQLFNFDDVINHLTDKLIRRHPDVFAQGNVQDVEALEKQWQEIKQQERLAKKKKTDQNKHSLLDDIAINLPALSMANKLQTRAASVGFDWENITDVMAKLESEVVELQEALAEENRAQILEELGDLMFSCVNLSRHLKADPEKVMRQANRKFKKRFQAMEQIVDAKKKSLKTISAAEFEILWQKQKHLK